ncbi:MAG: DNA mismatch repair endonuclease MutL [Armatimonadetes bacterium]|nr:DNA mismatch repair endonuclease MutL [Armatimonadota bacterium]
MSRIRQLSPEVANQIAAGEVIERPAGAVKELVENALDAGARRIQIDIEEGGKKLIRVRDDGGGMSASDAVLSLQRHATSKISDADDLWRVQTLGFRGEALPSLAAVSRLEIVTREENAEVGTQLVVEAGTVLDVSEVGCAPGTEITVRGLFFNTPARFKFLKSDAAEAARISEMIGHLALAYPAVSFVLKHNGNEQLRVEAGGDAFNALVAVLGKDTARQMLPISTSEEFENIRVSGFTGRPQLTRANRNGQLFFVNGRLIKNRALQHAFGAAYEGLLHGRDRFPLGVVFMQVAPGAVDVNVHPTKLEVRFAREGEAHHALRVAVRDTLVGAQLAPSWGFAQNEPRDGGFYGPFGRNAPPDINVGRSTSNVQGSAPQPPIYTPNYAAHSQPLTPTPTDDERERFRQHLEEIRSGARQNFEPQLFPQPEAPPKLKLRPLAQITNNSYMLCEGDDGLYIVNQHRAHERILADNAIAAAEQKPVESQRLVIPFTVEIGARAIAAVEENGNLLSQLGFEVETFGGNALLVRAVPYLVAKGDYERAFGDLLDELVSGHAGRDLEERRRALLTMLACKNAIKAGDALPLEAMQRLVDDLAEVQNPSICPHGQPILIKISTYELHKKFEREYAMR